MRQVIICGGGERTVSELGVVVEVEYRRAKESTANLAAKTGEATKIMLIRIYFK
jgi:hypothetical protein